MKFDLRIDDLQGPEIADLLRLHLNDVARYSPPESVHALDMEALRQSEITFWTVWHQGELLGCGALKALSPTTGEIKSMRTHPDHTRKGVAAALLTHLLAEARTRGYTKLFLETGSQGAFEPARCLYQRFGFTDCEPFAHYRSDRNSVFMQRNLPCCFTN